MIYCWLSHYDYHVPIVYDKEIVVAVICTECNWIIQKFQDTLELAQTFTK